MRVLSCIRQTHICDLDGQIGASNTMQNYILVTRVFSYRSLIPAVAETTSRQIRSILLEIQNRHVQPAVPTNLICTPLPLARRVRSLSRFRSETGLSLLCQLVRSRFGLPAGLSLYIPKHNGSHVRDGRLTL